jgi:hypothetical protein
MNTLGAMLTCYDEIDAVKHCINEFRIYYPNEKIFIVTESNVDYSKFFKKDKNIVAIQDEDTMSFYCNNSELFATYKTEDNQIKIKKAVTAFLKRVDTAIKFCNSDYLLLMDPDVLVRGRLTIPNGVGLLGSLTNKNVPSGVNDYLCSVAGATTIDAWGATPGIFNTKLFYKAYNVFNSNKIFLDRFALEWPAFYAHDIIIPTIFALIGEKEIYNNDFTECNTDSNWKINNKVLVHHFKKYYPDAKNKFPWWND